MVSTQEFPLPPNEVYFGLEPQEAASVFCLFPFKTTAKQKGQTHIPVGWVTQSVRCLFRIEDLAPLVDFCSTGGLGLANPQFWLCLCCVFVHICTCLLVSLCELLCLLFCIIPNGASPVKTPISSCLVSCCLLVLFVSRRGLQKASSLLQAHMKGCEDMKPGCLTSALLHQMSP